MDISNITDMITNTGFPIAACFGLAWFGFWELKESNRRIDTMTKKYEEQIKEIVTAVTNNTHALEKLCEKLGDRTQEHDDCKHF